MDRVADNVKRVLFNLIGGERIEQSPYSIDYIVEEVIEAARLSAPRRCDCCGEDADFLRCSDCVQVAMSDC